MSRRLESHENRETPSNPKSQAEHRRFGGYGPRFLARLDGEFALALFDFKHHELILARDVFGTKPLWFARAAERFGPSDGP